MSSIEMLFHPSIKCSVLNFSTIFDVSFFKSLKDYHENSLKSFPENFSSPSNIYSKCVSLPHLLYRLIGYCLGMIRGFPMSFSYNKISCYRFRNTYSRYDIRNGWYMALLPTERESLPEMKSTAIKINNIG